MFGGDKPASKIVLDLIRHGEPEGGVKYRGSLDDPLSATGWQQLRTTTRNALNAGTRWDAVISSPMLRCKAFAEEIAAQQKLPLSVLPDLRELCFGELEGLRPSEAWAQYPELLKNLWQAPELHTPPGGEPFGDFIVRVKKAVDAIIAAHLGQHVLVVAHGGVIRATLSACLNFTPRDTFCIEVPYAGMTRLRAHVHPAGTDGTPDQSHTTFALAFINGFMDH